MEHVYSIFTHSFTKDQYINAMIIYSYYIIIAIKLVPLVCLQSISIQVKNPGMNAALTVIATGFWYVVMQVRDNQASIIDIATHRIL